jgi:ribosomal protein S7
MNRLDKFSTIFIKTGKKAVALSVIRKLLILVKETLLVKSSVAFVNYALSLVEPSVDIRKTRSGGRLFFVPIPCRSNRKIFLATAFFLEAVKLRKKNLRCPLEYAMFLELNDIVRNKQCLSLRRKKELMLQAGKYKASVKFLQGF